MRGSAVTLTCPRCGDARVPAGDRTMVVCAKCALVYTVEQGQREKLVALPVRVTSLVVESHAQETKYIRVSLETEVLTIRLTRSTWSPQVGLGLASIFTSLGMWVVSSTTNPVGAIVVTVVCGILAAMCLILSIASLVPIVIRVDASGIRTRGIQVALVDARAARAEIEVDRGRRSHHLMIEGAGHGGTQSLAICADEATAVEAARAINAQLVAVRIA